MGEINHDRIAVATLLHMATELGIEDDIQHWQAKLDAHDKKVERTQ